LPGAAGVNSGGWSARSVLPGTVKIRQIARSVGGGPEEFIVRSIVTAWLGRVWIKNRGSGPLYWWAPSWYLSCAVWSGWSWNFCEFLWIVWLDSVVLKMICSCHCCQYWHCFGIFLVGSGCGKDGLFSVSKSSWVFIKIMSTIENLVFFFLTLKISSDQIWVHFRITVAKRILETYGNSSGSVMWISLLLFVNEDYLNLKMLAYAQEVKVKL
jgi:hypothetical protein